MIVLRGGEVLTDSGWQEADVAVDASVVDAVAAGLEGDIVVDASGCLVGPGFVDMHTHLRQPGQTWKEDIASASAAAAAGGFTAVTAMPNTDPAMDSVEIVESVLAAAGAVDLVDVIPSGALTVGRAGTMASAIEDLYRAGVRMFTDDGDCLTDTDLLREVMSLMATLPGAFVAQHAEAASSNGAGLIHEGLVSRHLAMRGVPSSVETKVVARDLEIAGATGSRYHCQHVSARETVEAIAAAKDSGVTVTAEVTPHHLSFDDSWLIGLDPNFKMYPPLRSSDDRAALIEALIAGVIDVVATDHAPHLPEEKAVDFISAPRGVIGLETAGPAVWEVLGDRDALFRALSIEPARILGLADQGRTVVPGVTANLVVFDPSSSWTAGDFRSKSSNSPYRGRVMNGRVKATLRRGRLVYRHEERV